MMALTLMAGAGVLVAPAQDLPPGKGKETLEKVCGTCHGVEAVTGIRNSKEGWTGVVDDMVSRGASGSDAEFDEVLEYLVANFPRPVNVNKAAAVDIAAGLDLTAEQADAIVKYRTDKGPFKTLEDVAKVPGIDAKKLESKKNKISF